MSVYRTSCRCPTCGSGDLVTIDDDIRDLRIFKCCSCGDMYAAQGWDVIECGEDVFRHWAYAKWVERKLTDGGVG